MAKEKELKDQVIEFFKDNKKPTYKKLKSWIDDSKLNEVVVCDQVCEFATRYVAFLTGGRSQGVPPKDLITEEEKMGIEVEYEHTPYKTDAQKIAWDHLTEVKHYYTMLKHGEGMLDEMGDKSEAPKNKSKKINAMMQNLIKVANDLDERGFHKEADEIDIICAAYKRDKKWAE